MGPLAGYRVLEFAGIGPGPFCAMLLGDLGAEVVRIDRPDGPPGGGPTDIIGRGRRSIGLDLKQPAQHAAALRLIASADALIEGFRPGVMERLGLGPARLVAERIAKVEIELRRRARQRHSGLIGGDGGGMIAAPAMRHGLFGQGLPIGLRWAGH